MGRVVQQKGASQSAVGGWSWACCGSLDGHQAITVHGGQVSLRWHHHWYQPWSEGTRQVSMSSYQNRACGCKRRRSIRAWLAFVKCSEFNDMTALDFHKFFSIAIMNMSVAHSSEANTSTRCKQSFTGSLNPRRRILVHRSCLFFSGCLKRELLEFWMSALKKTRRCHKRCWSENSITTGT